MSRREVYYDDRRESDYVSRSGARYDDRHEDRYSDRDIVYRRSRPPPVKERDREEVRFTETVRAPDYVLDDHGRSSGGQMVLRAREREEFDYVPRRGHSPSPERRNERESITIRRDRSQSRPPAPPPPEEREREEIIIRRTDVDDTRSVRDFDDTRSRRSYAPPRDSHRDSREFEREEIIIRRDREEGSRLPPPKREPLRPKSRERERSLHRRGSMSEDEIIIRRDEREGRKGEREREEIIIHRRSRSASSSPSRAPSVAPSVRPAPPQEPPIVQAPTIHQEVVTHHRHIDHGYEVSTPPRRVISRPPSPPSPPRSLSPPPVRERSEERIEIHRAGERNGKAYHDDIIINRDDGARSAPPREAPSPVPRHEPPPREVREERFSEEVDIYQGARTRRGDIGARFGRSRDPNDGLWTEVTKDLVVKEAITEMGYEWSETQDHFYIYAYLRYDDMIHLVGLSEEIRKDRLRRVKEIEYETKFKPAPESSPRSSRLAIEPPPFPRDRQRGNWDRDDERYIEREVVYRGGRPPPPVGYRR